MRIFIFKKRGGHRRKKGREKGGEGKGGEGKGEGRKEAIPQPKTPFSLPSKQLPTHPNHNCKDPPVSSLPIPPNTCPLTLMSSPIPLR